VSDVPKLTALLRKDARGVYRDRFLLWLCVYPLVLAALLRAVAPWIPIDGMRLYLAPAALMLAPNLLGIVLGFALIEEREQKTWLLLRVLPLRERTLFGYLATTATLLSLLLSLACAWIYGLPVADLAGFLGVAAANALTAPLLMLMLGAAAANKIEGLALGKIISTSSAVPLLCFVLAPPWQVALVWSPFYWIYLGLLRAYAGEAQLAALPLPHWPAWPGWSYALVPAALCVAGVVVFARIYRRRAA